MAGGLTQRPHDEECDGTDDGGDLIVEYDEDMLRSLKPRDALI
jgi:hypothetical protein